MADLKDKQIRLVGSQNFAYATGSNYTQGHVHFTTDEHGSIVVNGKVYGTTDAAYVYVGSENIPTYVNATIDAKINALDGNKTTGSGKFVSYVKQENGNITVTYNTLQNLVTVDNSEAKAYDPKDVNESVKFIKSFEIEGDTIIPKWDYFANNIPATPNVTVSDTNYNGCYLPEFSASGHTITVTNGTQVTSYSDFKELKSVVDTFFGGAELDTKTVKSYIDTLAEIQEAFKNSYAEGIANSVNNVGLHGVVRGTNSTYSLWITYTTNGGSNKQSAYIDIPAAESNAYGLVKYDDSTIKKNTNGQLYVNGALTDTKYSMNAANHDGGAYVKLVGTDSTATTVQFEGTGIATVSYSSTDKAIKIHVPETVVNYNHHSTNTGSNIGEVTLDSNGAATTNKFISSVNLSADGKLTYSYITIKHETNFVGGNFVVSPFNSISLDGSISIPKLTFNTAGHLTAYENIKISGIAAEDHSHDEFVWL